MNAPGLAVENAMKMSPEPLPDIAPVRARPRLTRRARRFNWCGSSGASVAATTMTDPVSASPAPAPSRLLPSVISFPTGAPATINCRRTPKLAWSSTPTV